MESRLTIKNFRIFDENGVTFELNPITILTGANNSGKSSVVKAVSLLNGFLSQIQKDIESGMLKNSMSSVGVVVLDKYRLDFTSYPNNLLGGFDRIINDGSESKEITFEYTVYSKMISEDVTVKLTFVSDINDEINYGFIKSLEISSSDGTIFSSSSGKSESSLNLIKERFFEFAEIEHVVHEGIELIDNCTSDEETNSVYSQVDEKLKCFNDKRVADVISYLRFKKNGKIYIENEKESAIFNRMKENGSLFQFSLIDEISELDKQEVPVFIDGLLAETKWSEERLQAIHRVLNDFMESDFPYFREYFNTYEDGYLYSILDDSQTSFISFHTSLLLRQFSKVDESDSDGDKISVLFPDYANDLKANLDPLGLWSSLSLRKKVKESLMKEGHDIIRNEIVPRRVGRINSILKQIRDESPVHFAMIYHVIKWLEELYILNIHGVEKMSTLSKATGDLVHNFATFADDFVRECFCTDLSGRLFYIEPTFANIKRLYPLDSTDNFTSLLRTYFESKRKFDFSHLVDIDIDNMYEEPNDFINYWIKEFGLGECITLNQDEDKLGVQIRIHDAVGDKGRLLADAGCGTTQLVSILLQIETAILSIKSLEQSGMDCYALECLDHFSEEKTHIDIEPITIIVEEPEVHLHPAFQSKLTDMFLDAYEKFNIHFIIETHSEYLIRKTQVYVKQMKSKSKSQLEKKNPFAVYYVPTGGKPYKMEYRKDGKFSNEFGPGFFDEASNLLFDIL